MEETSKRKVKLIPLVFGHLFLGLGIFYIGYMVKNKLEMLSGLLVLVLFVVAVVSVDPATGQLLILFPVFGALTWAYIIIRLIMISNKGSPEIVAV